MDGDVAKAAATVRAGLADKKPDVRGAAVGALVGIGPKPEDLPALLKLLKERNGETREAAVQCLGRLGPAAKEAVPQLMKLLIDDVIGDVRAPRDAPATSARRAAGSPKLQEAARNDPAAEPAAKKALEKLGVKEKR